MSPSIKIPRLRANHLVQHGASPATTQQPATAGYYRIGMTSDANDVLVVFAPLSADGGFGKGPGPHMVWAITAHNQQKYYGEIDSSGVIDWANIDDTSETDLFEAPIKRNRRVEVPSFYNEGEGTVFRIAELTKL